MTHAPGRSWISDEFGVRLVGDPELDELVDLALRRNPRRAHLLVSRVLGKHIPVDPRTVRRTGLELGRRVSETLDGRTACVIGFAETATGLGHCVAEALGADYLHSTRRSVPGVAAALEFEEEHSHATMHRLLPGDPQLLCGADALVLVDDELSTGRTAMNTIAELHRLRPRAYYAIAALVDVRGSLERAQLARFAAERGITVDVVCLAEGSVTWPAGFPQAAASLVATRIHGRGEAADAGRPPAEVISHRRLWPTGIREGGRHGFTVSDVAAAHGAARNVAEAVLARCGPRVLVLGTEELMYAPVLIAAAMADKLPCVPVSSTTRSPVLTMDESGYPVRSVARFDSHDATIDGPGVRFAYNLDSSYSDVVLVVDSEADTTALHESRDGGDALVPTLQTMTQRVHVVVLPTHVPGPSAVPLHGPQFGSYSAAEVAWLLTDLSGVALEAPTQEREEAIQSGAAHYAESLPIEYQPDADYHLLFERALAENARRIAEAVGTVTEIVLNERGPAPVLVSLARAGTPVGILMRRWAAAEHGLDLRHYAISIVRGRGIDTLALRYLAHHHDPRQVVFVDGWTGKGAITRELRAAVEAANDRLGTAFDPELVVVADPGSCVTTFGTRADFLIPSACLNSTVSGLVSRTVLNSTVLGPDQFHGAKFYRHLSDVDQSARFVDTVSGQFAAVASAVRRRWRIVQRGDRSPTWSGWRDVEELCAEFGIDDPTLVKPGVGETTRVLLRRVPWLVLTRPDAGPELDHVRLLAERRSVPVREYPGLTYSCVGIIHPKYTRGAAGLDAAVVAS